MTYSKPHVHRWMAAVVVWPIAVLISGLLFISTGPYFEGQINPVLKVSGIGDDGKPLGASNITRDGRKVCWIFRFQKRREATPQYIFWGAYVAKTFAPVPIVVATIPAPEGPVGSNPYAPGEWEVAQCTILPESVSNVAEVKLKGSTAYITNHSLWLLWQDTALLDVPPPEHGVLPLEQ